MRPSYTREQRAALEAALKQNAELRCPACGGSLSRQAVVPPDNVSYVRRRVWLLCGACGRSASLDER